MVFTFVCFVVPNIVAATCLTPEKAREALVDLMRNDPHALPWMKFDPDEYALKPLEDQGGGRYRLGWFEIDVSRASYQLLLIGKKHHIHYEGEFRFEHGRWVAKTTESSIGCSK
jgi:hypothetical protein